MSHINVAKFAVAVGAAVAVIHLGCVVVMSVISLESAVFLANSLIHGVDFTSVARADVSLVEVTVGLVGNFVVGSIAGAVIAVVYNVGLKREIGV